MGWKWIEIGKVCKTGAGGTPLKAKKEYYESGSIPWLLSGEVAQREIIESKNYITEKGLNNSSAKIFPINTVLVAMYGATAGQVGILRFESSTNQAVCGILPTDKLLPEFIYYSLLFQKKELVSRAAGNAQPNLSQIKIKDTKIPLIAISEQKQIVVILEEAFEGIDAAIANTEKNLANARELFESYLNGVFTRKGDVEMEGWQVKKLSEICEIARGGSPRPIKEFLTNNSNGINWIKISDATASSKYIYETKEKIKPEGIRYSRFVEEGDFILSNSMSFGRPYIMKTSGCIHDGWLVLHDRCGLFDSNYLYYFLGSHVTYKQFDNLAAGSTVRNLNINLVSGVKILLPSLEEQRQIVAILDKLKAKTQELESIYTRKLEALKELKQSILEKAFTGELTSDVAKEVADTSKEIAA